MKKRIIPVFLLLIVLATTSVIFINKYRNAETISAVQQFQTAQAEQTEDPVIKYKTTTSVAISWENMLLPEGAVKYTVYKNGQAVTTITDKVYNFTGLTNGTAYNFKIEFLDVNNSVLSTKLMDNIAPAKIILNFNQNMTYEKDTYYLNSEFTIPSGVTINFAAGSIVKVPSLTGIIVNGTLNFQGNATDKIVVTSTTDVTYGGASNGYWKKIQVNSTGTLNANSTIFRLAGQASMYFPTDCYSLESYGITKLNNVEQVGVTQSLKAVSGSLEVINSKITCSTSTNPFILSDLTSIDIQNSVLDEIIITYYNQNLQNNVNILNNTLNKNGISYTPNVLSTATIKNNVRTISTSTSVIKIQLSKANANILDNISGNSCSASAKYGEIEILSMPTNMTMTFPKRNYFIGVASLDVIDTTISSGTTINIAAGSIVKIYQYRGIILDGTLNLQGTADEKVIMTSVDDTAYGGTNNYYWRQIQVNPTGTLNANNTIFKLVGKVENYPNDRYSIDSRGIVKLNNVEQVYVTRSINAWNGSLEITNSKITAPDTLDPVVLKNLSNIDIQNSTVDEVSITYDNQNLQNNVNILNNTFKNSIKYTPTPLSTATIKNNISTNSYPIQLLNPNTDPNIFANISNNTNPNIIRFKGIYINGTTSNLKLKNYNEYIIGVASIGVDKIVEIEAGTRCKFTENGYFSVDGNLVVNGTNAAPVVITSINDPTIYSNAGTTVYGRGIEINPTGLALINNMTMRYCGYYSSSNWYFAINNRGKLYMMNSSINNLMRGWAISYNTNSTDQLLKYNQIEGYTTSSTANVDATLNYWMAANGPRVTGNNGSGSQIDGKVTWSPYNSSFIKDNTTLDTYINDVQYTDKQHFGEVGVNEYTGNYSKTYDDLSVAIPNVDLKFTRTYNSKNLSSDILGQGWTFGFSSKIDVNPLNSNILYAYLPNGSINTFTKQSNGTYLSNDSRNILTIENNRYVLTTKEQTKYLFSDNRYLFKIIDKYGNSTNVNVDTTGKITSIVDYAGRTYTINYTNNKVSSIVDPLNRSITYNYNSQGLLSEVIGLNGKSTYYEYDANGYMTYVKEKNDTNQIITVETITYSRDSVNQNRVATVKDTSGKIDTYSYNLTDKITNITDQNGRVTKKYFDVNGYPVKMVEPNGLETNITYDTVNGVNKFGDVKTRTEITGQINTYEYDSNGNITKQINTDGSYKLYEYNAKNSLTKETDEVGNVTQYVYATDGSTLTKKILPNNAENSFEYYQSGIQGLVSKKTDELGKATTYEYDNYGNLSKTTDAKNNFETYTHNSLGWLLSKTTAEGYTTTYEYDNVGNNTKTVENSTAVTLNEYNYKNRVTKTTDANNNITTYQYDNAQNLTKKIDQENNTSIYEYDIYNNVTKETKPNGAVYKYYYDNLNRNTKIAVMLNNIETTLQESSYNYANGNKTVTTKVYSNATDYTINVKVTNYLDKVISDKTENAEKTYTYLTNGQLSSEQNEIGKRIYYYYNPINKVIKKYEEIDNDKYSRTNYEYDLAGNAIKEETLQEKVALDGAPNSYITTNYIYDDIGNLVTKTTSSGEEFKYTYDKDKNVVKQEVKISDGKYRTTEFAYNYAKKITSKKESIEKGSIVSNSIDDATIMTLDTAYEYDNMNNLVKETSPDGTVVNHYYDKINRETKKETVKDGKTITELASYLADSKDKITSKTDGNSNVTTYDYDMLENMIKETKPNDIVTTYEYDLFGNPTKEILPNNVADVQNNTTYTCDKYGNVVTKTRNYIEDGQVKQIVTTYEYDLVKNLTKETTAGVVKSSTYNKAGKVTSKTDGSGKTTNYEYDAKLNVVRETDPRAAETTYSYDERNNLVKKDIDSVTQQEYTYDLVNNKLTEKDELTKVTNNTYDLLGNLIKQVDTDTGYTVQNQYTLAKKVARTVDSMSKEILYTYDILNNVVEQTEQKNDGTQKITVKAKYDNLSNKIEETDGNGNVTTYEYDGNNKLVKETNPKLQITTYTYDKNGNKLTETDYLNNTLTNSYDKLDRLVEKLDQYNNRIEKLVYDDLGRQIKSIDANNSTIEFTFDNNNNVLTKKDQEGNIESYEYDANNNKTKYTDKNSNVTSYEYNNKNKVTKVTNPLNEVTTYVYDNKGNLLKQTDAKNNSIEYTYDKNSNETSKKDQLGKEDAKTYYPNGLQKTFTTNNADVFSYTYDIHGRLANENIGSEDTVYEYDNNDNQTKVGGIDKTYDELNRLLTQTENGQTVTYSYDDATKTKTITDPKNNVTTEEYDKANRLKKVTNNSKVTEYVYNTDGSMQKQINPTTTVTYEYYPDKKVKHLTTKDESDIVIEENEYEYDANNNITKDNNKVYTYDALNRIKTSNNTEYTYDEAGNILSKTELAGNTIKLTSYTYNAKNQLLTTSTLENLNVISESTFIYDDNGNQLNETTNGVAKTNVYNARNELTEADDGQDVSSYSYNAEGKRIQKISNSQTTKFVYDGDNVILELDDQNNQTAANIYGLALIKRTTDTDGYYLYNGHGDVTKILDENNSELNTYAYDEFGKILSETENFDNPFKYAGYYYDKETKTYYLKARYYNPEIQRFISEDTYRGVLEDPLSLNLYTYVKNNPLIYVDPTGHVTAFLDKLEPIMPQIIGFLGLTAIANSTNDFLSNVGNAITSFEKSVFENAKSAVKSAWDNFALDGNVYTEYVPTSAGLYPKIQDITFADADTLVKDIDKLRRDDTARIYMVYKLIDPKVQVNEEVGITQYDQIKYIGMTMNLKARTLRHANDREKKGLSEPIVIKDGLTKQEARIVEQTYITAGGLAKYNGQLKNKINSIGDKGKLYSDYYNFINATLGTNTEAGKISNRLEDQMLVMLGE